MKKSFVRTIFAFAALFVGAVSQPALAQGELFVTNFSNNSVTVYSRTVAGNTAPIRTLSGPLTGLNASLSRLVVDTVNNELVVPNFGGGNSSVTVYSLTASGNTAPIRTLSGALTQLNASMGLAVDTVNNELVVGNVNSSAITVYSRTASGNIAPTRTLSGALTGLSGPQGLVVDTVNNELVVVSGGGPAVTVYSRTASGNTAPIRTLSGALTGLSQPEWPAVTTSAAPPPPPPPPPPPTTAIPTLSEWTLMLLAGIVCLWGAMVLLRRRD